MEPTSQAAGPAQKQPDAYGRTGGLRSDPSAPVWRVLLRPALLAFAAGAVLLLLVAALTIPQLPDQLRDEPAASGRWMLTTAAAYGGVGPFLQGIGLFDVLHSPLFRLALALLTLVLAAHLANAIGKALDVRRVRRDYCTAPTGSAEALTAGPVVYRHREALDLEPATAHGQTLDLLEERFDNVEFCEPSVAEAGAASQDAGDDEVSRYRNEASQYRSLATRHPLSYTLRPLLPLGALVALAVVWAFLFVGWELHSPTLAPGDVFRAPSRDVAISYIVSEGAADLDTAPGVAVQIGERTVTPDPGTAFRARLGSSRITANSGAPGLLVRVPGGDALLAEPGESDLTSSVGFILPSPGSEESLLIPGLSWGLRVVRRTDAQSPDEDTPSDSGASSPGEASYYVELYQGAELLPQQRIDVDGAQQVTIAAGGNELDLELLPLPGIDVTIRHAPGAWLLWIAAALAAAGFAGLLRAPAILLATVGAWPVDRSVVTLAATDLADMEAIMAGMAHDSTPAGSQSEADSRQAGEPGSAPGS